MATTKINAAQLVGTAGAPAVSEVVKLDSSGDIDGATRSITGSGDAAFANGNFTTIYGDGSNISNIASDSLKTTTDATNATRYVPFIDQATGQTGETVYIADTLSLNPSTDAVGIAGALSIVGALTGVTTLAASSTATVEGVVSGAAGTFDALAGTSLALQTGGITAAGSIAGATAIDGTGDLTMGTITMTGFSVDADGDTALKSLAVDDSSTIGCDSDTDLLTLGSTAVTLAADATFYVRDAGLKINSSANGFLDITADTKINLSGAVGANGTVTVEGVVSGAAGTFDALAGTSLALQTGGITAAGAIAGATSVDGTGDLTMGTITMTGFSVDADGDTALKSLAVDDSSTIGCDSDTDLLTLGNTAVSLAADATFYVRDAGLKINSSKDGYLDITADTKINLSGAVGANSTLTVEGVVSGAAGTFDALAGTSLALQTGGITAAGAIAGATSVDGTGDLTMGTITMTGFSVDADGDTALKSLAVDNGSTIGCDADTDLLTLGSTAVTLASDAKFYLRDASQYLSSDADNYIDISAGTQVNVTGALNVSGEVQLGSSAVVVAVGADSFYIKDATDGKVHSDSIEDVATGMAGAGLQATSSAGTFNMKGFITQTFMTGTAGGQNFAGPSSAPSCSLSSTPIDLQNVLVYLNGQLQASGSSKTGTDVRDYSLSGSVVGLNNAVDTDDLVKIVYLYS
jgi:hypothetical protein